MIHDISVPRCPECGGAPDEGGGAYWHRRDGSIMHSKCDPERDAPPRSRLLPPEVDAALYRELIPHRISRPMGTHLGPTAQWEELQFQRGLWALAADAYPAEPVDPVELIA